MRDINLELGRVQINPTAISIVCFMGWINLPVLSNMFQQILTFLWIMTVGLVSTRCHSVVWDYLCVMLVLFMIVDNRIISRSVNILFCYHYFHFISLFIIIRELTVMLTNYIITLSTHINKYNHLTINTRREICISSSGGILDTRCFQYPRFIF